MNDIERVKGFGKTLKAFQTVADQLNEIADLQATEKEAKRRTEEALSELFIATDNLNKVNNKLQEANSLKEDAYKQRDSVDKSSKEAASHILSKAKNKAEDMIQNAQNAADQIRHTHQLVMQNLKEQQDILICENEKLENTHKELQTSINDLRVKDT